MNFSTWNLNLKYLFVPSLRVCTHLGWKHTFHTGIGAAVPPASFSPFHPKPYPPKPKDVWNWTLTIDDDWKRWRFFVGATFQGACSSFWGVGEAWGWYHRCVSIRLILLDQNPSSIWRMSSTQLLHNRSWCFSGSAGFQPKGRGWIFCCCGLIIAILVDSKKDMSSKKSPAFHAAPEHY